MRDRCPSLRVLALAAIVSAACASKPPANVDHLVVADAKGVPPISGGDCSQPFELDQDCSNLWGAQRTIEIDRVEMQVAGSADGRHVLIMPSHVLSKALKRQPEILTLDSNTAYYRVKAVLDSRGIEVVRVIPSASEALVGGYLLELDRDGYSVLKEYSK